MPSPVPLKHLTGTCSETLSLQSDHVIPPVSEDSFSLSVLSLSAVAPVCSALPDVVDVFYKISWCGYLLILLFV